MSQSTISSFFKRKDNAEIPSSSPVKRLRSDKLAVIETASPTPLSDRTRHWHFSDLTPVKPISLEKEARRAKFVDKLGDLDQRAGLGARSGDREDESVSGTDESDLPDQPGQEADSSSTVVQLRQKFSHNGEDSAQQVSKDKISRSKNKSSTSKFTPLESQIQKIQDENPSIMLLVEVGYKYRFFGPDARKASKILGIACFKSRAFLTASIPTHRLYIHINRLVQAGVKVGVVRQTETAALKAVGDTKNKTFDRKLCEIYTKATYLGSDEDSKPGGWILAFVEDQTGRAAITDSSNMHVDAVIQDIDAPSLERPCSESPNSEMASDAGVSFGVVAIRAESGEVLHDTFEDGALRSELGKRLLLLEVSEVVVVGEISSATRKLISRPDLRVEEVARLPNFKERVRDFYYTRYSKEESKAVLTKVLQLPGPVLTCLSAQIDYLTEFNLHSIFTLTNFFQPLENRLSMRLPATTIAALEVFKNTSDGSEYGSLFWLLDHTQTRPGKRLLRKWVSQPLLNLNELENRQGAVAEIVTAKDIPSNHLEKARIMMRKLPDLEKGLSKVFYGKCSRPEVLQVLQGMSRIARAFDQRETFVFDSPCLNESFSSFPSIFEIIEGFLAEFNHVEAAKDDKYNMFKESDALDSISDHKMGILIVESDLRNHLVEIGKTLKRKVVDYVTVAGIEYLIEIKNDATKLVPRDWLKVSGTKYVSRFHTPLIIKLVAERERRKELLAIECDKAYKDFLQRISNHYDTLRWVVSAVAEVDCLMSLARASSDSSYTRPTFHPGNHPTSIDFKNSRHPIIEKIITESFIPNDLLLRGDGVRAAICSGPNMGGKSSFIKQVALICIMAQIGCYVPCDSAEMTVLDGIYCRMGASDDMLARESTFMVELHECSDIMAQATPKSLVILDELGRGTSTFDGLAIASASLYHFLHHVRCLTLFVTHYPSIKEHAEEHPELIAAWHMDYLEDQGSVTFLYKLTQGMADRSYGLNVAKLAGLENTIIQRANVKAKEFEEEMEARQLNAALGKLERVIERFEGGKEDEALAEFESIRKSLRLKV